MIDRGNRVGTWINRLVAAMALSILLTGCDTTQALYEVTGKPIKLATGKGPTLKQVRAAITGALGEKNWRIDEARRGHIVATHAKPNKSATVAIRFSTKAYSINYVDSTNFAYDEKQDT